MREKLTIRREDGSIAMSPRGGKVTICYEDDSTLIIKESGYTGYVDRSCGSVYSIARYKVYRIAGVKKFKHTIEFDLDLVGSQPVKSDVVSKLLEKYEELHESDPLGYLGPREKEDLLRTLAENKRFEDELISGSGNCSKNKEE